jgi:hypothetical protein
MSLDFEIIDKSSNDEDSLLDLLNEQETDTGSIDINEDNNNEGIDSDFRGKIYIQLNVQEDNQRFLYNLDGTQIQSLPEPSFKVLTKVILKEYQTSTDYLKSSIANRALAELERTPNTGYIKVYSDIHDPEFKMLNLDDPFLPYVRKKEILNESKTYLKYDYVKKTEGGI